MRNRKRLAVATTLVLAVVAVAASVNLASGASSNVQTLKAKVTALDGALGTTAEKVKLFVKTTTETDPPGDVPVPVRNAKISFDKAGSVNPGTVPNCDQADIENKTTAQAKAACPDSIVGSGHAIERLIGGTDLPGIVTAFDGAPKASDPANSASVILLHTYVQDAGLVLVLRGFNRPSIHGARYGRMVDVDVPALPGGAALVEFDVTVKKGSYLKAFCPADGLLKAASTFTYYDDSFTTPTARQRCP